MIRSWKAREKLYSDNGGARRQQNMALVEAKHGSIESIPNNQLALYDEREMQRVLNAKSESDPHESVCHERKSISNPLEPSIQNSSIVDSIVSSRLPSQSNLSMQFDNSPRPSNCDEEEEKRDLPVALPRIDSSGHVSR